MGKVVFFAGPPGSGKSTLVERCLRTYQKCERISYGEIIYKILIGKGGVSSYDEFREHAGSVIDVATVRMADAEVAQRIGEGREETTYFVELHSVTSRGDVLRATPYIPKELVRINPDAIVYLAADGEIARQRLEIRGNTRLHNAHSETLRQAQAQMALVYGGLVGCPVYLIDANRSREEVFGSTAACLMEIGLIGMSP